MPCQEANSVGPPQHTSSTQHSCWVTFQSQHLRAVGCTLQGQAPANYAQAVSLACTHAGSTLDIHS